MFVEEVWNCLDNAVNLVVAEAPSRVGMERREKKEDSLRNCRRNADDIGDEGNGHQREDIQTTSS